MRRHASGMKASIFRFGTSATSSVLHNLATSGHLVFSRTALSSSSPDQNFLLSIGHPGFQNVCPFDRQLRRQAPMAQALDDSHRPVVHRCRRLQTPRTEVIIALPPSMPPIPVYRERSTTACVSALCAIPRHFLVQLLPLAPCRIRPPRSLRNSPMVYHLQSQSLTRSL